MPKKFGINPKVADARARVEEQKQDKRQREEKAKADAEWADEDKALAAKLARQKVKEEKKQLELQRKKELRDIEEAEAKANAKIGKKVRPEQPKATRSQIQRTQEISAKVEQAKALSADAPAFEPPADVPLDADINPNHAVREEIQKYGEIGAEVVTAETIDEAIETFESGQVDRHPEKRMAKAWKVYVYEHYKALKAENPSLKRSQLMELLHDQWKKAPQNPLNQDHFSYNYKSG